MLSYVQDGATLTHMFTVRRPTNNWAIKDESKKMGQLSQAVARYREEDKNIYNIETVF